MTRQPALLDLLRSHGGSIRHETALIELYGLVPVRGRRGGTILDYRDPEVNAARVSLHRCVDRLVRRGLVYRIAHGIALIEGASIAVENA